MPITPDLLDRLAARLGPGGFSTDPDVLAPHLREWRGRIQGVSPFLAMPGDTAAVADVVRLCREAGAAITPQGGNTGLVGGQIPDGEILLSLKRMNRIRSVDPANDSLVAEAGAVLAVVQEAAIQADRRFPLSLGSQGSAMIGGLISTNAGGVHVMRFGMMRELVLGLEAVLPDGRVLDALSPLRKNNTGYDLKQLLIGAEGTLGVITAAALKLAPAPRQHVVAMAGVTEPGHALTLLHAVRGQVEGLSAFELMNRQSIALALSRVPGLREPLALAPPFTVLLEFETTGSEPLEDNVEAVLADMLETGVIVDAAVSRSQTQAREFWRLRESLPEGHRTGAAQVNLDISVPVSQTPAFIAAGDALGRRMVADARVVAFGHMGDGNIHFSVLAPDAAPHDAFPYHPLQEALHDLAVSLGGSISAEHGIGVARKDELLRFKDPVALDVMRTLKAALDPQRLMNPRALI
jgi:FAD/FMN-containing dehydrogenase